MLSKIRKKHLPCEDFSRSRSALFFEDLKSLVVDSNFFFLFVYRPWAMDPSVTADLEAAKDPGALKAHTSVTDNEILGKLSSKYNKKKVPK